MRVFDRLTAVVVAVAFALAGAGATTGCGVERGAPPALVSGADRPEHSRLDGHGLAPVPPGPSETATARWTNSPVTSYVAVVEDCCPDDGSLSADGPDAPASDPLVPVTVTGPALAGVVRPGESDRSVRAAGPLTSRAPPTRSVRPAQAGSV